MRSLVFNLFFYALTFGVALRVWFLGLRGDRDGMYRVLRYWGRTTLRAIEVILRGRVEIRGLERIPESGPVLFAAKHQSELDIVLLGLLMPHTGAIAMQELERYPFFGPILRTLDVVLVPVSRGPQNRTESIVEGTARCFAQGRPMMIYPEGTLMRPGDRERYRRGVGHLYTRLNPTVVPVATSVGLIWPRRHWRKHAGRRGVIEFLEPIEPGLDFEAFMELIERTIEGESMRLVRESAPADALAEAEARFEAAVAERGLSGRDAA
ncbi:MAG: lysophospholipid acyltransferase family protein [Paracoccaceae bacterium]